MEWSARLGAVLLALLLLVWCQSAVPEDLLGAVRPRSAADVPLFVIGGVQKAGTTVLASYLARHPNISFSRRKELHFFDKNRFYRGGVEQYLQNFHIDESTIAIGEATPSYIASRLACQRLSIHFPNVRMIILLREPVARAYSEFQMKVRRVQEQEDFIQLIHTYSDDIYDCIESFPANYKAIRACMPDLVRDHGRVAKLTKALRLAYVQLKNWAHVQQLCFTKYSTPLQSHPVYSFDSQQCTVDEDAGGAWVFHPKRCWTYYPDGYEKMPNLTAALVDEVDSFRNCSGPLLPSKDNWTLQERLVAMDEAVSRCVQVRAGISTQFYFRSMYAAQIYHCQKYIPAHQTFVLGSESLRANPHKAVAEILRFLQFPNDTSWLPHDQTELNNLSTSTFTDFARTTGWRLSSTYEEIPEWTRRYLADFFAQWNSDLFALIGKDLSSEW